MRKALIALILAGSFAAGRPALVGQLWSLVASPWKAATENIGLGFDPDGQPKPQSNIGLGFDPNG
jgi:hypothetical protein